MPSPYYPFMSLTGDKEANKKQIRPDLRLFAIRFSLNFIRLLRVVITPSVRGEKDSKQSHELDLCSNRTGTFADDRKARGNDFNILKYKRTSQICRSAIGQDSCLTCARLVS